jgi:hypothetical protein
MLVSAYNCKSRRMNIIRLLSLFLLINMVPATTVYSQQNDTGHRRISVDMAVKGLNDYVGREITVRGYLVFGTDAENLWQDRRSFEYVANRYVDPDDPAWSHCVTVIASGRTRSELIRLSRHYVLLTGVLYLSKASINSVSFGSCSDIKLKIRGIQILR